MRRRPQKIAYLAADYWRKQGVLDAIRIVFVLPDPKLFKVPVWTNALEKVVERYGIEVRYESEVTAVDGAARELSVTDLKTGAEETLAYDMAHLVPPQSAPDWVKASPLAEGPYGFVKVDKHTLRSPDHPEIFALGGCGEPAHVQDRRGRAQAVPVVVEHLVAAMKGAEAGARYDGYTSCPLVTARDRMLLAEFDYDLKPKPSFPLINTFKERRDMWVFKRYVLPVIYWRGMMSGRV